MSEILLQTLVEKMSAFQKEQQQMKGIIQALPDYSPGLRQANQRIDALQAEIKNIPERISIPEGEIKQLRMELAAHREQLQQPLQQEVRHHHHLSRPVWGFLIISGIALTLLVFLILTWNAAQDHRDADIKLRFMKLTNNPNSIKALYYVDTLYASDPDKMRKDVEKEEQRRQQESDNDRRTEEKKGELQELEKEGKDIRESGRKNRNNQ